MKKNWVAALLGLHEEDEFAKTVLSFILMGKKRMTLSKRARPLNQHDNLKLIERYT